MWYKLWLQTYPENCQVLLESVIYTIYTYIYIHHIYIPYIYIYHGKNLIGFNIRAWSRKLFSVHEAIFFFWCSGSLQTTLRKMRRCSKRICRCGTHGPSADFFLKGIWAKTNGGKQVHLGADHGQRQGSSLFRCYPQGAQVADTLMTRLQRLI